MPRRPARGIQTTAFACGRFLGGMVLSGLVLSGCTETPAPLPLPPTTAVPPPPTIPQPSSTAPPAGPTLTTSPVPAESAATTPAFQELRATLELFSREKLDEGASAVLIKAKVGRQEWTLAEGVRTREEQAAVQPGDRFPVGDQFRTLLAVSVMKLVEEGRLGLDDSVTAYLPGSLTAGSPVTIRQLLGDSADVPAADLAAGAPPDADALLGRVVEQLRGAPLGAVLRTDVLAPLNLQATEFLTENSTVPDDVVHGYVHLEGETVDVTDTGLPGGIANGGLVSTVEDISIFQAALLKGQLLSPEGLIAMKGTVFADYGLGLDHWDDRCTNGFYYGHAGDIPGYGSIAISSADGNRQLSIFLAYPPQPVSPQPSALALEMTGVAQVALNSGCRFQFR